MPCPSGIRVAPTKFQSDRISCCLFKISFSSSFPKKLVLFLGETKPVCCFPRVSDPLTLLYILEMTLSFICILFYIKYILYIFPSKLYPVLMMLQEKGLLASISHLAPKRSFYSSYLFLQKGRFHSCIFRPFLFAVHVLPLRNYYHCCAYLVRLTGRRREGGFSFSQ